MSDFDKSDWDKTIVPKSSGLGIRSTINQTLNSHEDTLHSEAKKLFESMDVMEQIVEALNLGASSVNISFPANLVPESRVIGKYNWSDVAEKLVELIQSEGVRARYTTKLTLGGCCEDPKPHYRNRLRCINCMNLYKKHNTKALSLLILQELK